MILDLQVFPVFDPMYQDSDGYVDTQIHKRKRPKFRNNPINTQALNGQEKDNLCILLTSQ